MLRGGIMVKRIALFYLLLSWMALAVPEVAARELEGLRHSATAERTRIVLDLSADTPYEIRRVESPERIVLELPRTHLVSRNPQKIGDGRVLRVRFNDLNGKAQIVFDLDSRLPFRHFALAASGTKPARIVVDVMGRRAVGSTASGALPTRTKDPNPRASNTTARSNPEQSRGTDSGARTPVSPAPRAEPIQAPGEGRPYIIVIDPGHGGRDPGTAGCGVIGEKRLVLGIAKAMQRELEARSDFEVILTRKDDRYVDLHRRVKIAREAEGDLFISIHANSARSSRARGSEVYFLSPRGATDQAAAELANRENAAHMVGMDAGAIADDVMMSILMDLQSSGILRRSGQFAELTLRELGEVDGLPSRHIKQARFAVLRTLSMPSILVEVGYLSNRGEAKHLKRKSTQQEIGARLANAVITYCLNYGERGKPIIADRRAHIVRRGDTLWELAQQYGTSVAAITQANGLRSNGLRIGQELVLP